MPDSQPEHNEANSAPFEIEGIAIPDAIVFDGTAVGYVDRDGNIRSITDGTGNNRAIGHIANDRDFAIGVLRDRYIQYVEQMQSWCNETCEVENPVSRLAECDRHLRDVGQQYVLGNFDVVRSMLTGLKSELLQEQQTKIAQRTSIIAEAKQLASRTDWKVAGEAFDALNQAFRAVGSIGDRAQEQNQWDSFKEHEREFRNNRKAYFDEMERQFAERANSKKQLCEQAESSQDSDDFKFAGQRFRDLMDEWKTIGFAGREHDEALWQRFQAARTVFAERRIGWFEQNTIRKEELTVQAEALAQLEDSAAAHLQMKPLVQQWRDIGSAGKQADDALWSRFRAAQDSVYQRSREVFDARHQERLRNYEAKQSLVIEAESLIGEDSRTATARSKALQQEWKRTGQVPREQSEQQWQRFRSACDSVFRIAAAEGKRRMESARDRAEDQIRKLSAEIDEHESKIEHWQNVIANLRDGNDADEIRESMEAKIATAKERIEVKLVWIEEHFAHMTDLARKM